MPGRAIIARAPGFSGQPTRRGGQSTGVPDEFTRVVPITFSPTRAVPFSATILLMALAAAVSMTSYSSPQPKGRDTPSDEFSAERAIDELAGLLGDEQPHPIGSAANAQVRARLMERLAALELQPAVQDAVGCRADPRAPPRCGRVSNIVGRVPGERQSAILLMAHYDSMPATPGAADDGAGVAVLLEIARIVRQRAPPRNTILFVFTDGEEAMSLGAAAFFAEHPSAQHVRVVLNLEATGTSGPSFLFQTGANGGVALRAFQQSAKYPSTLSWGAEYLRYASLGSDFELAQRAGRSGLNFAFVGDRHHYHTPLDSMAALSRRSVQHHGENVLPVLTALADAGLEHAEPGAVYANHVRNVWLTWLPETGVALAVLAMLLVLIAAWRFRNWLQLAIAAGAAFVILLATVAIGLGVLRAADVLAGSRVDYPANPWPWRLLIYSTPVFVIAWLAAPLVRRVGAHALHLAVWWWWTVLALVLAVAAPMAANLIVPPSLVAGVVTLAVFLVPPAQRALALNIAGILSILVGAFVLLPAVFVSANMGLRSAAVLVVPLAFLALTLMPVAAARDSRVVAMVATATIVGGLVWSAVTPLHSRARPQHLNFTYFQDVDAGIARFTAFSPDPLPTRLIDVMPFSRPAKAVMPWVRRPSPSAEAPIIPASPPEIDGLAANTTGDRVYRLRSTRNASLVTVYLPISAGIASVQIDGRAVTVTRRVPGDEFVPLLLYNPPPEGFEMKIRLDRPASVEAYVADTLYQLPSVAASLVAARGDLAVPFGVGDAWIVYRKITL